MNIADNVREIQERICQAALRVGREPSSIQLLAATKTVSVDVLTEAYDAGLRLFGENRLQEAQEKKAALGRRPGLKWHFIGRMQRRKLKDIVGQFVLLHSVETVAQAQRIDVLAQQLGIHQEILLEVNVAEERTKGGFVRQDMQEVIERVTQFSHVVIRGLMTLPPFHEDPEKIRPYFSELRQLRDSLMHQNLLPGKDAELSMGMSHDYHVAIEEGATMVRIGSALFGERG